MSARSGIGYDVHRLAAGRRLVLGGCEIPEAERGLEGHSDADVLTHAVIDALLGAAGLGDIGEHFPDTDERYRDADSMSLLGEVCRFLEDHGWTIRHLDATVVCQEPKLAPHRERMRRSRLYLPGNEPKFLVNAGIHGPDGVILDLEDSVHPSEKDAARLIVRNALRQVDFMGAERMVRINQGERGLEDLKFLVPHNVHVILIPKCEDAGQVKAVDEKILAVAKQAGLKADVLLMPIVESAAGALRAFEIASASPRVVALTIGLEDYTADIGTRRTPEGRESFWARSQVVNAARAAGVQPIDTVFSDVRDMEGLRESVLEAKGLGFEGKGCIHPRQIDVIHEAFAPTETEIERAKRIVTAFEEAEAKGLGVVSLGSKMIDPPVVKRALHTVRLAIAAGKLDEDWRNRE